MEYKLKKKNEDIFFRYLPKKKFKKSLYKKTKKESPFGVLKSLNLN